MFSGNFPEPFIVFRSIGVRGGERFGVGAMDKSGMTGDYIDRAHPAYVVVVLFRGSGRYIDGAGNEYPLGPGSCFQRFRNCRHSTLIDPASGWYECFLELGESAARLLENCGVADPVRPVVRTAPAPGLMERFRSLGECFNSAPDSELVRRLPEILELAQLCLIGNPGGGRRDRIGRMLEQACALLGGDFRREIDLDDFCRRHGWGYENFRKVFREELGISPYRYRIRRRLDAACALLAEPGCSIRDIAEQLGYSSPYEFSAQFKRYLGCAPSAYRPGH